MKDSFFRELTPKEEEEFRQYARDHKPDMEKWGIYHPVCRREWIKIGLDALMEDKS